MNVLCTVTPFLVLYTMRRGVRMPRGNGAPVRSRSGARRGRHGVRLRDERAAHRRAARDGRVPQRLHGHQAGARGGARPLPST